jgi:hypothetical protein
MTDEVTSGHQHDTPKKNHLVGAIKAGKNVAQAAHLLEMPYSTTSDIWKKYKKMGLTRNLPHSGHSHKLRDPTKRLIIRTALKMRCAPFAEIANQVGGPFEMF